LSSIKARFSPLSLNCLEDAALVVHLRAYSGRVLCGADLYLRPVLNQPIIDRDQFTESAALSIETITYVHHWTDSLFTLKMTRPASFRFRSGEFVMIGLVGDNGKPLLRAYSIASPSWDDELEFYSSKVPDGPLTSRLQHIQPVLERQPEVQHGGGVHTARQLPFCGRTVTHPVHLKSELAQAGTQSVAQQGVVFSEQDAHQHSPKGFASSLYSRPGHAITGLRILRVQRHRIRQAPC